MKNYISILLALILCTLAAMADKQENSDKTESPYFYVNSGDSSLEALPLLATFADIKILGTIADVTVHQTYVNRGKSPIEATYMFPASTRAAVYGMTMQIAERILKAEIQEKKKARQTYETARNEGKSASLLEQIKPNMFQMSVANIMPGDTIYVELKYTELLVPTEGEYEFAYPTVVGPRYTTSKDPNNPSKQPYTHSGEKPTYKFGLKIRLTAGMPIDEIKCQTHEIRIEHPENYIADIYLDPKEEDGGNRDFILKYRLSGSKIETGLILQEGRKENFFMLMLQPPKRIEAKEVAPREYIFLVDISGSMHGYPLDKAKIMMEKLFDGFRPDDFFNVVLFSGSTIQFSQNSVAATSDNIKDALKLLNTQMGAGGTEMLNGIKRAMSIPQMQGYARTLVIITDGFVDCEPEIFDFIHNHLGESNFFSFGIGTSVNRMLMEGIARVGLGEPFIIQAASDADKAAERFYKYISSPILTNISVKFDGFDVEDVEPPTIPDLFAERPLIIHGKWHTPMSGKIIVNGTYAGTDIHVDIPVKQFETHDTGAALRNLWARTKISRLSDIAIMKKRETDNEVVDLGIKYNLLTQYTSFVAVDYEVRNNELKFIKVQQPLPLPEGVSDYAIGNSVMISGGIANSKSFYIGGRSSGSGGSNPLDPGGAREVFYLGIDFEIKSGTGKSFNSHSFFRTLDNNFKLSDGSKYSINSHGYTIGINYNLSKFDERSNFNVFSSIEYSSVATDATIDISDINTKFSLINFKGREPAAKNITPQLNKKADISFLTFGLEPRLDFFKSDFGGLGISFGIHPGLMLKNNYEEKFLLNSTDTSLKFFQYKNSTVSQDGKTLLYQKTEGSTHFIIGFKPGIYYEMFLKSGLRLNIGFGYDYSLSASEAQRLNQQNYFFRFRINYGLAF
ncbi:MAG: VIT and VWA domain-containing protein [Candidatus Kapabacteria bacterium]|nr:VIT and VWA domain-containing protein [Candidatus Kapabacteria bacterium]